MDDGRFEGGPRGDSCCQLPAARSKLRAEVRALLVGPILGLLLLACGAEEATEPPEAASEQENDVGCRIRRAMGAECPEASETDS